MAKKKKFKITKYSIIIWSLTVIVGFLSWYTNYMRTINGYFDSPNWIFINGLMYTILSALIVGGIISGVLPKK